MNHSGVATMLRWDPVLDPNRPVIPTLEPFGTGFGAPIAAILAASWGLFIVLATIRLFAALAAAKSAEKSGSADDLITATSKIRGAGVSLALLLSAAAIVGAYIAFANRLIIIP